MNGAKMLNKYFNRKSLRNVLLNHKLDKLEKCHKTAEDLRVVKLTVKQDLKI